MPRTRLVSIAAGGLFIVVLGVIAGRKCGSSADVALLDPPPEPAPSGAPAIRFIGRFDRGDVAGPRFAWSGSTIHARFRGTQASIRLKDSGPNTYTVLVDKQPPRKMVSDPQQETHVLATALANGEHDVTIVKNTEAFVGEAQFLGLDFGPGGELLAPRTHTRRIEIVGDSISCGFGIEGKSADCKFSPETENAYMTYGEIAGRALGAEVAVIAWSGIGVLRNGDGSTADTMPIRYSRALPQYAWSKWDIAGFVPDAVVVNLGANDFFAGSDPGEAPFVAAYRAFLDAVRQRNPGAQIIAAMGPMLADEDGNHWRSQSHDYIARVVKEMNAGGDGRIAFLEFVAGDVKREGLGCGEHPSAMTNRRMGAELAVVLKKALAW